MTKAEQAKMKARERARRHYEKKKLAALELPLESGVEQAPEKDSRHLAIVGNTERPEAPIYAEERAADIEIPTAPIAAAAAKEPDPQPQQPKVKSSRLRTVGLILRGIVIAALTGLMAFLQADFYAKHDILPQLAWPFAIAVELGFLSLATLKFEGAFDWVRRIILAIIFIYFGATLIFQIGYKARSNIIDQKSVEIIDLQNQLKIAEDNLDVATRGKSWDNMRLFGGEVVRLQTAIRDLPRAEALGVTQSEVALFEASLLVVMRVLLLAISGLNTVKLRDASKA